jgi:hypothetical protein
MVESGLNLVSFLAIVLVVIGIIVVGVWVRSNRKAVEDLRQRITDAVYTNQPEDIRNLIDEAVEIGADWAESIDLDGQLRKLYGDFATKGQAKLYAAIDAASEFLETELRVRGYNIDIPQEYLKVAIQTFVFNNRDFYPTHKTLVVDTGVKPAPTVNETHAVAESKSAINENEVG